MFTRSRAEMVEGISRGRSIIWDNRSIDRGEDLPSQEELDAAFRDVQTQDVGDITESKEGIPPTQGLYLIGWAATEIADSAAVAEFVLRRGIDEESPRLCPSVKLAAGESASDELPGGGAACPEGVFVELLAGQVDLVLYFKLVK